MKQAIMKLWVKALRSGKYKQTRYKLRLLNSRGAAANSFCCLGVLCDLFAQDHPNAGWAHASSDKCVFSTDKTAQVADFAFTALPLRVRQWAGIKTASGHFDVTKEFSGILSPATPGLGPTKANLADLNDKFKFDFSKIADVVEKHWRKL